VTGRIETRAQLERRYQTLRLEQTATDG